MFKPFLIALVAGAGIASSAFAQPLDCPIPVYAGAWDGTQTQGATFDLGQPGKGGVAGAAAKLMYEQMANAAADAMSGSKGGAVVSDPCDGELTIDTGDLIFQMKRYRGKVAGGYQLQGVTSLGGVGIFSFDIEVRSSTEMAGDYDGQIKIPQMGIDGRWGMPVEMNFLGDTSVPVACQCPDKLQAFLDEQFEGMKYWHDFYADPALRKEPPGLKQATTHIGGALLSSWNAITYDRLITLIAQEGMPYEQAVAHLNKEIDSFGSHSAKPVVTKTAAGGTTAKDVVVQSDGATSLKDCTYDHSIDRSTTCYPEIAIELTDLHEGEHVRLCKARQTARNTASAYGVDNLADEEMAAYQLAMDRAKNWISLNCP